MAYIKMTTTLQQNRIGRPPALSGLKTLKKPINGRVGDHQRGVEVCGGKKSSI
jgi:hypothetical protein